ncbi:MAG: HEAT repeat domain-containing protein [Phycisphaeraceae bacterium]
MLIVVAALALVPGCGKGQTGEGQAKSQVTFRGETAAHWANLLKDRDPDFRMRAAGALYALGTDAAEAVPALTEALNDEFPAVRAGVAQTLGNIGTAARDAEPALKTLLDDKDTEVRVSAILALGQVTGSPAPQPMVLALRDESLRVRDVAAQLLVKLGQPAIEHLKPAVKDKDLAVRVLAAQVLGKIKHVEAVPILITAMEDEDRGVRDSAILALAETGEPAIPALGQLLKHEDWQKRWAAAYALNVIGTIKTAEQLVRVLNDEDERVREQAVTAMARIGKDAIDALAGAAGDKEAGLRQSAITALGAMEREETIPILHNALKDQDPFVREAAVAALGNTHSSKALPALGEALRTDDPKVRADAVQAMAKIGRDALEPLAEAAKHEEWTVRRAAAEGLGMLDLIDCVAPLNRLLQDKDARVRSAAASGLARIGPPARLSITPLINALKDESAEARDAASFALSRIAPGNETAIPALIRALSDEDFRTRAGAANAIARIGSQAPSAVYPLIKALKDEDEQVALAARLALVKLGREAITGLAKSLGDADTKTRLHVIDIMGQIGEDASPASHVLLLSLQDEDKQVRDATVHTLGLMGPQARAALLQASRGNDAKLAAAAKLALDTIQNP